MAEMEERGVTQRMKVRVGRRLGKRYDEDLLKKISFRYIQ